MRRVRATVPWACALLVGCGRVGFDAPSLDGGLHGGLDDGGLDDGATAGSVCVLPTSGSCGATSPFTRVQVVPTGCAQGTTCMIIAQAASQSHAITETAGDLVIAFAYGGQAPGGSSGGTAPNMQFAVTDTLGNTYLPGPYVNNAKYDDSAIQMFFAPNARGGANTVTVTESAPQAETFWTGLVLFEYSGVATTDVVDVASSHANPTNVAIVTAPAMTTRTECDLVVGGMANGHVINSQDTSGSGWAEPLLDEWDPAAFVDNVAGASLGDSVSVSIDQVRGADDGWVSTQMAFRAATTTAPCEPTALAFTTAPQTVAHATCSGSTAIASSNGGQEMPTPSGIPVTLAGATFFADPACQFPITETLIGAGTSSATFWYIAGQAGSATITASASGYPDASQTETSQ